MPAIDADSDSEALYHLMMGWVEARLVEGRIPSDREVARLEAFAMAGLERSLSPNDSADRTVHGASLSSDTDRSSGSAPAAQDPITGDPQ